MFQAQTALRRPRRCWCAWSSW